MRLVVGGIGRSPLLTLAVARRMRPRRRRGSGWPLLALGVALGGELAERALFFAAVSGRGCRGGVPVMSGSDRTIGLAGPIACGRWSERDGRLTRELLRQPGRFGLGQVPAQVAARRDDEHGLRLLLDRLRPDDPPPRRRGGQPHPDDRLPA